MKNLVSTLLLAGCLVACGNSSTTSTGAGGGGSTGTHSTSTGTASTGHGGSGGSGGSGSSTGTASTSGTGGSGPSETKACNDIAMARCNRLQECSGGALITSRYGDMATCVSRIELSCKNGIDAVDTNASPAGSEACAAAIPNESCTDYVDNNPAAACQPVAGTRAAGAVCGYSAQCASAFCDVPKTSACGTCAAKPADGAACTGNADCGFNQVCTKTSTCLTYVPEDGSCSGDGQCEFGLTCVGAVTTTTPPTNGTCQAQHTMMGEACDPSRKTGTDCNRSMGLYCNSTSKTCQAITFATDGQPCGTVNGAAVVCQGGGLCVITTPPMGTCSAAAADGAACSDTAGPPCLSPSRCVNGTCVQTDGAACM